MRHRRVIAGALVATGCLVAAAAVVVVVPRLRADPAPVPPGAPVAAVLRASATRATVGSVLEVTARVISGAPLAAVQLWAGGAMVDEVSVPGARRVVEHLEFTPREPGSHLLVLRVIDDAGRVAHAAPVRVRAQAPVALPAAGVAGPNGPAMRRVAHTRGLPGPGVTVAAAGCDATVRAAADPRFGTVALLGLGPGDAGFRALGYGDDAITLPLTAGEHAVYSVAYDEHGSAPSEITMVRAPDECATKRWQGTVSLVEGALRTPGQPSLAYLYLAVDGGQWRRVPAADQTFVHRNHVGALDFGQFLPNLDGARQIEIEAWTRRGGTAALLGRGTLMAKGEEHMPALVGFIPGTPLDHVLKQSIVDSKKMVETLVRQGEIHTYTEKSAATNKIAVTTLGKPTGPFTYRWKPPVPAITHGVWQVSMVPPLKSPTLEQPGLLAFDTVDATKTDFEIDFRPLVLPDYVPPTPPKKTWFVELPAVAPKNSTGFGGESVTQIGSPSLSAAQIVHALKPPKLYVRIVPMAGTQPVDAVSNPVTYTMVYADPTPPSKKIKPPPAITVDVKFSRPSLFDSTQRPCVRVVKNDNPGYGNPTPQWGVLIPGKTYCPTYDDDDEGLLGVIKSAVELAVDFWDTMVDAFGYLKAQVVKFIVAASGCESIPEIKSECTTVAGLAVDAALVYFGIPPSLPNSAELFALGKGELVDSLYALAATQGISCDGLEQQCKEMMAKALDAVLDYSEEEVSKAAKSQATSSGGDLYIHPSVVVIPEPRGQLRPAIFAVTYTRTTAKATSLPTACLTHASVTSTRKNYTWWDLEADPDKQVTGNILDEPVFAGVNPTPVDLAALKPGESVTRMVVLDTPKVWFPPGGDPIVGNTVVNSDVNDYAELMVQPSVLTATTSGCFYKQVDTWQAPLDGVLP